MLKSKENISINGVDLAEELTDESDYLNDYFIVNSVNGRGIISEENEIIPVTGMNGAHAVSSRTPVRHLDVTITAKGDNENSLHKKLERLDELIPRGKDLSIVFADEKDRTYHGRLDAVQGEFLSNVIYRATLSFICPDPYKYGPEKNVETTSDTFIIENKGTAESEPIFELTATQKATFAMVATEDEYNLIGTPADDDVVVVDEKTSVLYENGSTINTWITPVSLDVVDSHFIDRIDGVMGTDNAGIRPETWGTVGQKQHGAGALKELSEPIQDFEIESTFDIISTREIENWRMGIMLFDEFMNNIGTIGLKDNSRNYKRRTPLARIGPYRGSGPSSGYLVGDADRYDNARDTTLFYLRFRREGKSFNVYIGEWRSQRHVRQWTGTYHDVANEYMGRLKYISLYITSYQDRLRPSRLRINSVEVFELTKATVDQTPYIIYPGDVITFDHLTDNILLNGESRKDLKAFGGSFFTLKKGINTLTATPENTFNTKITYRERYK